MRDLDQLVITSLAAGEIESGVPLATVQARAGFCIPMTFIEYQEAKPANWSQEEIQFLRDHLGYLNETQIATYLGRSWEAVHLYRQRHDIPAPSKHPDYVTAEKAAKLLGTDGHKVTHWVDIGLLPGEILPGPRRIRRIRKIALMSWATNPKNWIWFNPEDIIDLHLRRLIELRKERWNDEWWNTNQVAAYHGVDNGDVERYIKHGKIKAVQAVRRDGRSNGSWANWFILRSEATRPDLKFCKGTGTGQHHYPWTKKADEFMLRAEAAKIPRKIIARLMKEDYKRLDNHLRYLLRKNEQSTSNH